VEWFWWDWSLSQWPTGFLQCFDNVGWVIWSVKIVPEMTYKVSSGTLSLYSLTRPFYCNIFANFVGSLARLRLWDLVKQSSYIRSVRPLEFNVIGDSAACDEAGWLGYPESQIRQLVISLTKATIWHRDNEQSNSDADCIGSLHEIGVLTQHHQAVFAWRQGIPCHNDVQTFIHLLDIPLQTPAPVPYMDSNIV